MYQSMVSYSPGCCQLVLQCLPATAGVSQCLRFEVPFLFFFAVVLPIWNFHWGASTCVCIYHTTKNEISQPPCASSISGSAFLTIFWRRFFSQICVIRFPILVEENRRSGNCNYTRSFYINHTSCS